MTHKRPVSVLVVIHDGCGRFLMLERADRTGFWQSVTGSLEADETPFQAALREVREETGFDATGCLKDCAYSEVYEIYEHWRHRYAPDVTHNTEHRFSLCLPDAPAPVLNSREHVRWQWLERAEAAERAFSPSNRKAIEEIV